MDARVALSSMQRNASTMWWERLMKGLNPPEAHYGPEYRVPRPRPQDTYYLVWSGDAWENGSVVIGMAYTQAPAPTTRVFALGLFQEYRGQGYGPLLRDALLDFCFSDPDVYKVETEVYASNHHSLGALHGKYGRMLEEGRQRATIFVASKPVDRVLFGITRDQWGGVAS